MAIDTDALSRIRVLVCLADADQGTALAHALREHDFDVLVAHHIRSAMRVMKKESPQAVIVEVATTAYDGFRVAQWAQGRIRAIFLVAGRQLTRMEDVEVLTSGAKELFYTPLQSDTIAASIRAACAPDTTAGPVTNAGLGDPKTQYSPQSVQMEAHAAHTVRSVSIIDASAKTEAISAVTPSDLAAASASAKTEAMSAVKPSDLPGVMDTVTEANIISMDPDDVAPTLAQGQFARRPEPEASPADAASEPATPTPPPGVAEAPAIETTPLDDSAPLDEERSSALVADLFDAPLGPTVIDPSAVPNAMVADTAYRKDPPKTAGFDTTAPRAPILPPSAAPERSPVGPSPKSSAPLGQEDDATSAALIDDLFGGPVDGNTSAPERSPEPNAPISKRPIGAPPDDQFLMSGMMDELDDLSPDSLGGGGSSQSMEAKEQAENAPQTRSPEDADEQTLPTEIAEGPSTVDVIAAAYGTSSTPKWVAHGLLAAVICASGWVGWLAVERLAVSSGSSVSDEKTAESTEAEEARALLHSTLGEATISHRDGALAEAKSGYVEALKQDPANQVALRGLASIAMQDSNWSGARESLNSLAEVSPDDTDLPLQQALILKKLDKRSAALAEFLRFIDSTKSDDPRLRPAAQVYLSLTEAGVP